MTIRIGKPRCLLIVAPHPDDEAIGAYALITRLRRRGVEVRIVVVTDGHASHRGSSRWPRDRLVRERQRETLRAMRLIGVPAGKIQFLGMPDGELPVFASQARHRIAREMRRAPTPLLVLAPSARDHHADHRVTAMAVAAADRSGVRRLAYPVWPAGVRLHRHFAMPLSGQERLAKCSAIKRYKTQAGRITDDPDGFAMTRAQIAAFSGPYEIFVDEGR